MILGTAGSGKTSMAILRAAYLSDPELPGNGRTLLLTFNKSLAAYIRSLGGAALSRVHVEHVHRFARGYLAHRGRMSWNVIVRGTARERLVAAAVTQVRTKYKPHPLFDRPTAFFVAEIGWLGQHGITSVEDYVDAARAGRAEARLERSLRRAMWDIREAYLDVRQRAGYHFDFDDLASAAAAELECDASARMYRHIVIDEGQDFSPEMLRALARAIPNDGSLSFFGDVAQQIYGHRMSWRSAGLHPSKIWEFKENYRNTAEIARLGLAIAAMPYYASIVDMVAPNAPAAAGPRPTLVKLGSAPDELALISDQAARLSRTQSVAVLARTVRQLDRIRPLLPPSARTLRTETLSWTSGPGLFYGTYHSAKGLEFDAVLLPFLSAGELPDPAFASDFGPEEAAANDGRLLYVGVTRARRALILTFTGEGSGLLPDDPALYTVVER